jgi:hypothetical protein
LKGGLSIAGEGNGRAPRHRRAIVTSSISRPERDDTCANFIGNIVDRLAAPSEALRTNS